MIECLLVACMAQVNVYEGGVLWQFRFVEAHPTDGSIKAWSTIHPDGHGRKARDVWFTRDSVRSHRFREDCDHEAWHHHIGWLPGVPRELQNREHHDRMERSGADPRFEACEELIEATEEMR